jgi:hypothetical protein
MRQLLWRTDPATIRHPEPLLHGVADACLFAQATHPRAAIDRYVAARAAGRAVRDTPALRRTLREPLPADRDPRITRYWSLVADLNAGPSPADAHTAIRTAPATQP